LDNQFEPLVLYVGAAGHRNIAPKSITALEKEVERLLLEIRSQYPRFSIAVLSPLADGADRICARAALKTGCRLIAALPMEAGEYKNDFDEASTLEFEELCEKAGRVFTVPEVESKPEHKPPRGYYYRQAGRYVAARAHILIALWDGKETLYPEGGGTFETIQFARERGCAVRILSAPRTGDTFAKAAPDARSDERFSVLNEFCADIAKNEAKLTQMAAVNKDFFIDAETEQALLPGARRVMNTFLLADALSLRYRRLKLLSLRLLSLLGLMLVLSFLLYDEMESDLMLAAYAAFIAAAVTVYIISSQKGFHHKYVTYRVMAEAMRVRFYWKLCGIEDCVYDSYTFTQKAELGFIKGLMLSLSEDLESFGNALPAKVRELWILGQHSYHTLSQASKMKKETFNSNTAKIMIVLSLVMFILMAVMELFFKRSLQTELPMQSVRSILFMHEGQIVWRGILKIALGTLSAGTAFLANYYGSLALPQQIFTDQRMKGMYESAARTDPADKSGFDAKMRELGRESLIESAGWYIAQRENVPGLFIN
jgi:hypothetical protein